MSACSVGENIISRVLALLDGDEPLALAASSDAAAWEVRAHILAATAALVAEHGYPAISASIIRSTAGVSQRVFAEHFTGKEAAFLGLYELIDVDRARFREAIGASPTLVDAAHVGALTYVRGATMHPTFARAIVMTVLDGSERITKRREDSLADYADALMALAQRFGVQVSADAVDGLVRTVSELLFQHLVVDGRPVEVLAPIIEEHLLRLLRVGG